MRNFLRGTIEHVLDITQLEDALKDAVEDAIDYDEIASQLVSIKRDEITEMAVEIAEDLF